jgi:hypothetical protein
MVASGTAPASGGAFQAGTCFGEIETLNWFAPGAYDENLRSCAPENVTRRQMAKVIVDYLDRNRDRLNEPFEGLALEAFAHTWPCAEKRGWLERWFDH